MNTFELKTALGILPDAVDAVRCAEAGMFDEDMLDDVTPIEGWDN